MKPPKATFTVFAVVLALLFAGYVVYPLAATVRESLQVHGTFSLARYAELLDPGNKGNIEAVRNSVGVSLLSVVLSGIVGLLFAFVFTQLDFPCRTILARLAVMPIALPPLVGVISFLFVFGESGILPRMLQRLLVSDRVPFSLDGFAAILVVHVYSFYVYFYLLGSAAFRRIDPSPLEAAANLGSGPWNTFRRVILPQLRPAMTSASILTFMASMASFSAPLLFSGGRRFITLQIYSAKLNGDVELAAAEAMMLATVSLAFFVVLTRTGGMLGGQRGSKGAAPFRRMAVSRPVSIAMVTITVFLLCAGLLPLLAIVLVSFAREGSWTWQLLPTSYTLENYTNVFTDAAVFEPLRNSLVMGVLTVAAALIVGVTGAYLITKGGLRRFRSLVNLLLNLPYAIPGTVIAISLILAFNSPTFLSANRVLVGTFWILPLAYVIRTYPLVVQSTSASLEQLDDSLLEAGLVFGAGVWRRFSKIALPAVLPGIVSGSLLTLISALGEFVSSILLYTYSSRPVSVEIFSQLRTFNLGAASAYSVVLLLLILGFVFLAGILGGEPSIEPGSPQI